MKPFVLILAAVTLLMIALSNQRQACRSVVSLNIKGNKTSLINKSSNENAKPATSGYSLEVMNLSGKSMNIFQVTF